MCAAPTLEGYQQPEGVQRPLYAALLKKVSQKAIRLILHCMLFAVLAVVNKQA